MSSLDILKEKQKASRKKDAEAMQALNALNSLRKNRFGFIPSAGLQASFTFFGVSFAVYALWTPGLITILDSYDDEISEFTEGDGLECTPSDMEYLLAAAAEDIMHTIASGSGKGGACPEFISKAICEAFREAGLRSHEYIGTTIMFTDKEE